MLQQKAKGANCQHLKSETAPGQRSESTDQMQANDTFGRHHSRPRERDLKNESFQLPKSVLVG